MAFILDLMKCFKIWTYSQRVHLSSGQRSKLSPGRGKFKALAKATARCPCPLWPLTPTLRVWSWWVMLKQRSSCWTDGRGGLIFYACVCLRPLTQVYSISSPYLASRARSCQFQFSAKKNKDKTISNKESGDKTIYINFVHTKTSISAK